MSSRKEKYPDTTTFHYHNQNPKGRITGDCTYRALSYATRMNYNDVVLELAYIHIETGYCDDKMVEIFLKKHGWKKMSQPRKINGKKYTVEDFVNTYRTDVYIIQMAGHISVVEYGKNIDIWDCVKYGGCVGNYYVKA